MRKTSLVMGFLLVLGALVVGCDEDTDTDAGVDAGAADSGTEVDAGQDAGPPMGCQDRCFAKGASCGLPEAMAAEFCEFIWCTMQSNDAEIECLEAAACADIGMSAPVCSSTPGVACLCIDEPPDAGVSDAGSADGGTSDAGAADAGATDAGTTADAGT